VPVEPPLAELEEPPAVPLVDWLPPVLSVAPEPPAGVPLSQPAVPAVQFAPVCAMAPPEAARMAAVITGKKIVRRMMMLLVKVRGYNPRAAGRFRLVVICSHAEPPFIFSIAAHESITSWWA
jgi:hypothetical protein